jgi:hypothetical protein
MPSVCNVAIATIPQNAKSESRQVKVLKQNRQNPPLTVSIYLISGFCVPQVVGVNFAPGPPNHDDSMRCVYSLLFMRIEGVLPALNGCNLAICKIYLRGSSVK